MSEMATLATPVTRPVEHTPSDDEASYQRDPQLTREFAFYRTAEIELRNAAEELLQHGGAPENLD